LHRAAHRCDGPPRAGDERLSPSVPRLSGRSGDQLVQRREAAALGAPVAFGMRLDLVEEDANLLAAVAFGYGLHGLSPFAAIIASRTPPRDRPAAPTGRQAATAASGIERLLLEARQLALALAVDAAVEAVVPQIGDAAGKRRDQQDNERIGDQGSRFDVLHSEWTMTLSKQQYRSRVRRFRRAPRVRGGMAQRGGEAPGGPRPFSRGYEGSGWHDAAAMPI